MESIKKLEEKWMMNQQKQGSDRIMAGSKDDCSDVTSNAKVKIFWNIILLIYFGKP